MQDFEKRLWYHSIHMHQLLYQQYQVRIYNRTQGALAPPSRSIIVDSHIHPLLIKSCACMTRLDISGQGRPPSLPRGNQLTYHIS